MSEILTRTPTPDAEPCPFCGGQDTRMLEIMGTYQVTCNDCTAAGPVVDDEGGAFRRWNERAFHA